MKNLREKNVDNDELMNSVNEIKKLIKEDRYNNDSIEELKKVYPDEIEKLENWRKLYLTIWVKMILNF